MKLSRRLSKVFLAVFVFVAAFTVAFLKSGQFYEGRTFAESNYNGYNGGIYNKLGEDWEIWGTSLEGEDSSEEAFEVEEGVSAKLEEVERKKQASFFVTIYDNGEKLTVKTTATTVGDLLSRAQISLDKNDMVEPGLEAEIDEDGFFVNIYRSRPVIVKDGKKRQYLMTASYDLKTIFREAGIEVYDGDEILEGANEDFLEVGVVNQYEIKRNGGREVIVSEEIPFSERVIKDYNLTPGKREVRELGEVGEKILRYEVLYKDGEEVSRKLISEEVKREPVARVVAVGASEIEKKPLNTVMGRNRYAVKKADGTVVLREETYYDLPMNGVMGFCGGGSYRVREDGVKVDSEGYVLVAANLGLYARCSIVQTSLGLGKVYDTGTFALTNPEQFDIATDWTNRDGR
ncbi:MAG: G5 domain-containing protein [Candidatus Saccharibacteria bacterium]|nr:G5 domain-containing protein [Candidatus Saccharibacteria bacterium]